MKASGGKFVGKLLDGCDSFLDLTKVGRHPFSWARSAVDGLLSISLERTVKNFCNHS